uniref:G_PROTEIN_RECEP_F1_2 domain-containing protein n=1 Tax=Caenorhabditis tropicalis TaxID=1561998 RepID=A0A1I7UE06_9PELO
MELLKGLGRFSLVSCIASIYALMLSLLSLQFYYRFIAVTSPTTLSSRFSLRTLPIYTVLIFLNAASWGLVSYYLNGPTLEKDLDLAPVLKSLYCLAPNSYAYIGIKYFTLTSSNQRVFLASGFLLILTPIALLMSLFSMLLYFGLGTYSSLKRKAMSQKNKDMQNQLLRTLVIQTVIPFCFMILPVGCMYLIPIIGWDIGASANLIAALVAIYPCFEPLVAMYCIKCFRMRIIGIITCRRHKNAQVSAIT